MDSNTGAGLPCESPKTRLLNLAMPVASRMFLSAVL